jgi:hypothetical protein
MVTKDIRVLYLGLPVGGDPMVSSAETWAGLTSIGWARNSGQRGGSEMRKRRTLWMVGALLVMVLGPAAPAQAVSASTVTVASSPAWGGQHVCLNSTSPVLCPADATQYGYPFPGWAAPRPPGANWIWLSGVTGTTLGADDATASFSQTIVLNGAPVSGTICLSADDYAELRVNGALVGTVGSTTIAALSLVAQTTCTPFDVTSYLRPGSNQITVNGQNGPRSFSPFALTGGCNPSCRYNENPAGVMFGGTIVVANPTDKDECKNGGWMAFGFDNQGQCVRFVETGKDSRKGE